MTRLIILAIGVSLALSVASMPKPEKRDESDETPPIEVRHICLPWQGSCGELRDA